MSDLLAKLRETADFCERLGASGMDGISALNLARDVLAATPTLNECEALLDLEAVARDWYETHLSTCGCQACIVLRRLDALRTPELPPENSKAAGTPAKSAPTASTEGA